jgi:hypothetical protein
MDAHRIRGYTPDEIARRAAARGGGSACRRAHFRRRSTFRARARARLFPRAALRNAPTSCRDCPRVGPRPPPPPPKNPAVAARRRRSATGGFSELAVIGEGGFGRVYRAMLSATPVAVKARPRAATEPLFGEGGCWAASVRCCTLGGGSAWRFVRLGPTPCAGASASTQRTHARPHARTARGGGRARPPPPPPPRR